jgi:hypothetical protein
MSIKQVIASAGKNLHSIIITAREGDGSVDIREAEPYSYRFKDGHELFFCYDIAKQGTCSFVIARIISVKETANSFAPRWPVKV